jgi:hypothetical protein
MAEGLISLLCGPASAWQRPSREAHMRAHSYSWDDATDLLLQALGAADRGAHAA